MTQLRPEMEDAPKAMIGRPVDHRGFYVPWFVTSKDENGLWDFKRVDPRRIIEAYRKQICFVSGAPLGQYRSFVIGPMCCINRITAEPPMKREIAEWSVRVCPWLSNPMAKRPRLEDGTFSPAPGMMDPRNPGISCIWTVKGDAYRMRQDRLIQLGEPEHVAFYTQKRKAELVEIKEAIREGGSRLLQIAVQHDGDEGVAALGEMIAYAGKTIRDRGGVNLR